MKRLSILAFATLLSLTSLAQKIDKQASEVEFEVSNMGVNKVKGSIKGMKGDVYYNESSITASSFDVTIDVNTFETGVEKRDKDMMEEKYFYAAKYPTIRFQSEKIIKTDGGDYLAIGKLTMRDVTRSINIPFKIAAKGEITVLTGEFTLNRKDYNIGENVSSFKMGEDVNVTITAVLR